MQYPMRGPVRWPRSNRRIEDAQVLGHRRLGQRQFIDDVAAHPGFFAGHMRTIRTRTVWPGLASVANSVSAASPSSGASALARAAGSGWHDDVLWWLRGLFIGYRRLTIACAARSFNTLQLAGRHVDGRRWPASRTTGTLQAAMASLKLANLWRVISDVDLERIRASAGTPFELLIVAEDEALAQRLRRDSVPYRRCSPSLRAIADPTPCATAHHAARRRARERVARSCRCG